MNIQVVAGLLIEDGKMLIAQRSSSDSNGGKWEFPGGKVETGESDEQALVRELYEELCLRVKVLSFFEEHRFNTVKAEFHLRLYLVQRLSGTIYLSEHSDFKWITVDEIPEFDFLSGDGPFLTSIISKKNELNLK